MLEAIQHIDFVYIYNDETPIIPLKELLPNFLVK
jgi:bifunctional ADP-heptose synthase (sugar kinase/adenylyltransferase)